MDVGKISAHVISLCKTELKSILIKYINIDDELFRSQELYYDFRTIRESKAKSCYIIEVHHYVVLKEERKCVDVYEELKKVDDFMKEIQDLYSRYKDKIPRNLSYEAVACQETMIISY